jgi:glycosyltransferase involved in cell wall biosynthesis
MKQLIIVATKVTGGKGGISSALVGYIDGLKAKGIKPIVVTSHDKNMLFSWLKALFKIMFLSIKYRNKAVFWFHCGPWLSLFRKFTLAIIPRLCGALTIGHIHSPTFSDYLQKSAISQLLTKLAISPYQHLIALTPWWKSLFIQHGIKKTITVSGNPNSQAYCDVAQQYLVNPKATEKDKKQIQILTMARLVEGKGVDLVIMSLCELPEHFYLVIAGDGQLAPELKALVNQLDLSHRVTFLGWVAGSQKQALLSQADIFCLPSTYDSFGMVFIEAMAFGLPVVAYDWGPIKDVVTPDVGLCCKQACSNEVAAHLLTISNDLTRYSGNGPKRVLTEYTPQVVCENIAILIR